MADVVSSFTSRLLRFSLPWPEGGRAKLKALLRNVVCSFYSFAQNFVLQHIQYASMGFNEYRHIARAL